jgi:hypothetical protein
MLSLPVGKGTAYRPLLIVTLYFCLFLICFAFKPKSATCIVCKNDNDQLKTQIMGLDNMRMSDSDLTTQQVKTALLE